MSTKYDATRRDFARLAGIVTVLGGAILALVTGAAAIGVAGWLGTQGRWGFAALAIVVGLAPVVTGLGVARAGWILVKDDERMSGEVRR